MHLIALLKIEGVGPVIAKNLIAYGKGVQAVFELPPGKLRQIPDVGPKVAAGIRNKPALLQAAEKELAFCQAEEIRLTTYLDEEYPERLKTIYDAPLLLFQKGPLQLNSLPAVAIVGTRKATPYGRDWAARFARTFAEAGINVVSGLAYGIDITAHQAVLEAGGITTAVVAHGLDDVYPARHRKEVDRLLENGAILSEYFEGTKPKARFFPQRNRILSGLAYGVVVIEAAEKGGALITARMGFEQNREVFAVPGPLEAPYSKGCNNLIRDNIARLVTDPEEVLQELGLEERSGSGSKAEAVAITTPLSAEEQKILNYLDLHHPLLLDQLAEKTGLAVQHLVSVLLTLEFKGQVEQLPGRKFVRKRR